MNRLPNCDDTIVAIASPVGCSPRGILRLSGPQLSEVLTRAFVEPESSFHASRACCRRLALPLGDPGQLDGLLFFWPDSRSYTRQTAAEFHTLGSPALLHLALQRFVQFGARLARAGEFSLRAFLAGRIDLAQAEAVLGLVAARDQSRFEQALRLQAGGLLEPLRAARHTLLDVLADLEAALDFTDEDITFIDQSELTARLDACLQLVRDVQIRIEGRSTLAASKCVVLAGRPNAGKSSLFNAFLRETRAIVSDQPGTTTDYLSARVVWGGLQIELVDTAGLEIDWQPASRFANDAESQSPVLLDSRLSEYRTRHSQVASRAQIALADIIIWCRDPNEAAFESEAPPHTDGCEIIEVWTKSDLPSARAIPAHAFSVCSTLGTGLDRLLQEILAILERRIENGNGDGSALARCVAGLRDVAQALVAARPLAQVVGQEELVAAEIRNALQALGELVGAVYTDDLLDRIFSRFCIGK